MKSITKSFLAQSSNGTLSIEAAGYTKDGIFFSELCAEFDRAKRELKATNKDTPDLFNAMGFSAIVKKHTGLSLQFYLSDEGSPNAFVMVPGLDHNNPIINHLRKSEFHSRDMGSHINNLDAVVGEIDREKGRVSGVFAEVDAPIYITKGLMFGRGALGFSAEEITAIVMHEIGHVFSFMETLTLSWRRNLILLSSIREFTESEDQTTKIKIISRLKAEKLLPKDCDERIVNEEKDKAVSIIFTFGQQAINEDQSSIFANATMCESAADQFAVRMGAGQYLTTALSKLYKAYNSGFWVNFFYWYTMYRDAIAIVTAHALIVLGIFTPLLGIFWIVTSMLTLGMYAYQAFSSAMFSYDDPANRIKRIRTEAVGALKDPAIPSNMRKRILESIDSMDKTYKDNERYYDKNHPLSRILFDTFNSFFRTNKKTREKQLVLEQILNNDLYVVSEKFK